MTLQLRVGRHTSDESWQTAVTLTYFQPSPGAAGADREHFTEAPDINVL